jgi:hypothetical protein
MTIEQEKKMLNKGILWQTSLYLLLQPGKTCQNVIRPSADRFDEPNEGYQLGDHLGKTEGKSFDLRRSDEPIDRSNKATRQEIQEKEKVRWLCARIHRSTRFGRNKRAGAKQGLTLSRTLVPGEAYRVYRIYRGVSARSRDS